MTQAPEYTIDPARFWADPYPDLARMRARCPIAYVPQLDAILLTRRDTIFREEKRTDVFSSLQPGGLMTVLMGENMMRKDGADHAAERRAIFPSVSPRTVRDVWKAQFEQATRQILDALPRRGTCDLVKDYAMPVSAEALKAITGLTDMPFAEMDRVSQGMIDGVGNYAGDPEIEARCHDCTASIDRHISAEWARAGAEPSQSLLSVMIRAGLNEDQIRANIKLAISGGQNEPRDASYRHVAAPHCTARHGGRNHTARRGTRLFDVQLRQPRRGGVRAPRTVRRHPRHAQGHLVRSRAAFLRRCMGLQVPDRRSGFAALV